MERIRDIECTHENRVKIRNMYVCIKCNRKFTEKQIQKIRGIYENCDKQFK